MNLLVLVSSLIFFILIGIPMGFSLGISSLLYILINPGDITLGALINNIMAGVYTYTFLAIPFYILAGRIMNSVGITDRIFDFALSLVGNIKGGLAHVNIVASMIFAGMSGSSVADAAGLGEIEIKAMVKEGYKKDFSAAITAASAIIGPIIPPGITFVLYGILAEASIGRLFLGGILPGILIGLSLMFYVYIVALKNPKDFPIRSKPNIKDIFFKTKRASLALLAPVIILGGIGFGVVTPTEAGVVAVIYGFLLGLIYRQIHLSDYNIILIETCKQTGAVMFVLAGARMYSYILTILRVPNIFVSWMTNLTDSPILILLFLNIILLILGMFMNGSSILMLTLPILRPLLIIYNIDLVHFGVVMTLNTIIGNITPPLGVILYIVADIAKIPSDRVTKAIIPFYIPILLVLFLITYVPMLVLWIPNLLMP